MFRKDETLTKVNLLILSQLVGQLGITHAKFEKTSHKCSSLNRVQESVHEILMTLKKTANVHEPRSHLLYKYSSVIVYKQHTK